MKKIIILSSLFLALTAAVLFAVPNLFKKEKPVSKEINLAISSNNNYSSAAYDDAKASVHVVITKIKGNQQTLVLDKVYNAMQLKQIPDNGNAMNSKVVIPNVFDSKEKLVVTYTITYDTKGSVIEFCNGKTAAEKSNQEQIDINI